MTVAVPLAMTFFIQSGAFAIWEGDQEAFVMLDGNDRGLEGSTGVASDMPYERSIGLLRPGRSHGEWPGDLRQPAQGCLNRSVHTFRVP
jgi:hypothetical protein